jgi:hypothetical protein
MMLALACAVVPWEARAQADGGMLGLPLVVQENGWARYAVESRQGVPTEVVFKVGATESHKGKAGRWILFELFMPEVGRVVIEFLVAGEQFAPSNVLRMRVRMPNQPAKEAKPAADASVPLPKPKVTRKGPEDVAGKRIEVTEYSYPDGTVAGWSPAVPGLGLTRMAGVQNIRLLAFGVGGDPWKGAKIEPIWPDDKRKGKR